MYRPSCADIHHDFATFEVYEMVQKIKFLVGVTFKPQTSPISLILSAPC